MIFQWYTRSYRSKADSLRLPAPLVTSHRCHFVVSRRIDRDRPLAHGICRQGRRQRHQESLETTGVHLPQLVPVQSIRHTADNKCMMSEYLHRYSRKRRSNCLRRGTIVTTTPRIRHRLDVDDTQAHNCTGGSPLADDGGAVAVLLV